MSEVGAAVVAFFIAFIGAALWWGFKEEIERLVGRSKKPEENLKNVGEVDSEKELNHLIKPLYLSFIKYPDDPRTMEREKFGLPMLWSLMSHPADKSVKYLHLEKADPVIEALQRYGNLAQPELRELIREFLEFKQAQKDRVISTQDPYFKETTVKVEKIRELATARYNELMWGKKDN